MKREHAEKITARLEISHIISPNTHSRNPIQHMYGQSEIHSSNTLTTAKIKTIIMINDHFLSINDWMMVDCCSVLKYGRRWHTLSRLKYLIAEQKSGWTKIFLLNTAGSKWMEHVCRCFSDSMLTCSVHDIGNILLRATAKVRPEHKLWGAFKDHVATFLQPNTPEINRSV